MKPITSRSRIELMQDRAVIQAAISKGIWEAVLDHARLGHSVPVARDGKVIWISPEEVLERFGRESHSQS